VRAPLQQGRVWSRGAMDRWVGAATRCARRCGMSKTTCIALRRHGALHALRRTHRQPGPAPSPALSRPTHAPAGGAARGKRARRRLPAPRQHHRSRCPGRTSRRRQRMSRSC
jgi:hypothetical protein